MSFPDGLSLFQVYKIFDVCGIWSENNTCVIDTEIKYVESQQLSLAAWILGEVLKETPTITHIVYVVGIRDHVCKIYSLYTAIIDKQENKRVLGSVETFLNRFITVNNDS